MTHLFEKEYFSQLLKFANQAERNVIFCTYRILLFLDANALINKFCTRINVIFFILHIFPNFILNLVYRYLSLPNPKIRFLYAIHHCNFHDSNSSIARMINPGSLNPFFRFADSNRWNDPILLALHALQLQLPSTFAILKWVSRIARLFLLTFALYLDAVILSDSCRPVRITFPSQSRIS